MGDSRPSKTNFDIETEEEVPVSQHPETHPSIRNHSFTLWLPGPLGKHRMNAWASKLVIRVPYYVCQDCVNRLTYDTFEYRLIDIRTSWTDYKKGHRRGKTRECRARRPPPDSRLSDIMHTSLSSLWRNDKCLHLREMRSEYCFFAVMTLWTWILMK
jgi:hypothetical protein